MRSAERAKDSPMAARHLTTNEDEAPLIEPISVRIPEAVRMTGLSKSKIYQLIASGDIEAALRFCVANKLNMIVSGGTSTGKTVAARFQGIGQGAVTTIVRNTYL